MMINLILLMRAKVEGMIRHLGRKKNWLIYDRNRTFFFHSNKLQIDMSNGFCPEVFEYVERLSTFVVLLKVTSRFSDQTSVCTVLDQPNDALPFLENLSCWGQACSFERQIRTVRRPTYGGWHNVQMFAVVRCRGPPNASVS